MKNFFFGKKSKNTSKDDDMNNSMKSLENDSSLKKLSVQSRGRQLKDPKKHKSRRGGSQ